MSTINSLVVGLLILLIQIQSQKQFLIYAAQQDDLVIAQMFYDYKNGYYVDMGAYDPIYRTTTIYVYTRGWNGLSFEANPQRAMRFPLSKPTDINLNAAVGQNNQFVTFYEFPGETVASTINKNVANRYKNDEKDNHKISIQINVPAMTMKYVCENYYTKKVNYLNLDLQGTGAAALSSNDWNNSKCRPEIIIAQDSHVNKLGDQRSIRQILQSAGYKYHSTYRNNAIFIDEPLFEYYSQKHKLGVQILKKSKILHYHDVKLSILKYLKMQVKDLTITDYLQDPIYVHYQRENTIVHLQKVNDQSNKLSEKKNRPIIIFQFNYLNTKLLVSSAFHTKQKVTINETDWFKVTVYKNNKQKFQVYILDLKYTDNYELQIVQLLANNQRLQQIYEISKNQNSQNFQENEESDKFNNIFMTQFTIVTLYIVFIAFCIRDSFNIQKKYEKLRKIRNQNNSTSMSIQTA